MKRAIIIDSEEVHRQTLKGILVNEGFDVEEAADGQKGIAAIRDGSDIAVIFLADVLPGLSGIDTLIAIRNGERRPEISPTRPQQRCCLVSA